MMYFDEIVIFDEAPEYNHVYAYCKECGKTVPIDLGEFDELVDQEYVTLKAGVSITCKKCGKKHEGRKITYKLKDSYATINIPSCPVCQSENIKKISTASKIFAAGTIGVFALPYTSKTFECLGCGYKF